MASRARKLDKSVHSPGLSEFRRLLIDARKGANLTQDKLAAKLKKPQSFVAKYEGGERRLDVIEFLKITAAIGADPIRIVRALLR